MLYGKMAGVTVGRAHPPWPRDLALAFPRSWDWVHMGEVGTGCESPGRLRVSRVCSQALWPRGMFLRLSGPAVAWGPRAGAAEGQGKGGVRGREENPDTRASYGTIKYNLETIRALGVEQRRAQSRWGSVSRVLAGAQAGVI